MTGIPRHIRHALFVGVPLILSAILSMAIAHSTTQSAPVWLGAGVTFSALLISARWRWPGLLSGAWIVMVFWGIWAHKLAVVPAAVFSTVEISSLMFGAWIASQRVHQREALSGAILLIIGALVGATLGGLMAVEFWQWQRPGSVALIEWRTWTFSTAVGILLVAPVVTAFHGFKVKRSGGMPMPRFLGGLLAFVGFIVVTLMVFSLDAQTRFGSFAATLAYLPMPFLLLAALCWGPPGGSLAILSGMLLILAKTAEGGGPFAITESFPGEAVIEVQGFVASWACVLLLMRALSEDRRNALEQQKSWRLRYERMLDAAGYASVEYDAVTGHATWGPGASSIVGDGIEGIGSIDEWLDRINTPDQALALAAWKSVASGAESMREHSYTIHLKNGQQVSLYERLASIKGADDQVEKIAALIRRLPAQGVAHG